MRANSRRRYFRFSRTVKIAAFKFAGEVRRAGCAVRALGALRPEPLGSAIR